MKREPFKFTVCSMCGKKFIKPAENLYKVNYCGRVNQCCSYTCYQKALRLKEELKNDETNYPNIFRSIKHKISKG